MSRVAASLQFLLIHVDNINAHFPHFCIKYFFILGVLVY